MNTTTARRIRLIALPLFFAGLISSFLLNFQQGLYWTLAAMATQVGLILVLLTESFGPVAASRSPLGRTLARLLLVLSVLVLMGLIAESL